MNGKRQGRPPSKPRTRIEDFQKDFLKIKAEYEKKRAIMRAMLRLERQILGNKNGKAIFHGTGIYCRKCDEIKFVHEFVEDLNHDPPRIRIKLKCGHWVDALLALPTKCPKCGGELQTDEDGLKFCILCTWTEQEFWE